MINIKYFASLRERLNSSDEALEFQASYDNVESIRQALIVKHGEIWEKALQGDSVLVAVNQTMSDFATEIADGDEVAFFPPVTGG